MMVSSLVEIKKNEAAKLAYLAMQLNRLEDKRLKLEYEYVYHLENYDSFELGEKIVQIFQRQRAIVVAMLEIDPNTYGKTWRYLRKWHERCQKYRLLPCGEGLRFTRARYYEVPEQYQEHFAIKELGAGYYLSDMSIILSMDGISAISDHIFPIKESRKGFMPIVSYLSNIPDGKKEFPFLWSINWLDLTVYSEIQLRHFVLPELRKLRRTTTNIFLKNLINYYYVFLRKCEDPYMAYFCT